MIQDLSAEDFRPFLDQELSIQFTPEVTLPATLISIVTHNENSDQPRRQPFSLLFRTPQKNEYYPQGIYQVQHPTAGDLHLFIVPIGPDANGMQYEIVFN